MKGWSTRAIQTLVNAAPKTKQPSGNTDVWNLNLDQIESHGGRVLEKVYVSTEKLGPSTFAFEPRTVLYSKLRPYLNKVVVADEAGFATTELVPLRCNPDEVHPEYLAYFLRSDEFLRFATEVVAGAKMPRMVMSEFWNFQVPVPPLPKQRHIAAILNQADALRAKRREALAQLDSLTQSIFIEMFGDPASNSLNLPLASLSELGSWHSGGTPPRGEERYFIGDIPWFSSGELEKMYISRSTEHISEEAVRQTSAKLVPSGALMLGMYDTAALKASITTVDCSCNQAIAFAKIRPEIAETVYVYYAIIVGREHFRRLQRGVRQKNLNLSMIRDIQIPAPTIDHQQVFSKRVQALETIKAAHQTALTELDSLFASLQHRAFRGEL